MVIAGNFLKCGGGEYPTVVKLHVLEVKIGRRLDTCWAQAHTSYWLCDHPICSHKDVARLSLVRIRIDSSAAFAFSPSQASNQQLDLFQRETILLKKSQPNCGLRIMYASSAPPRPRGVRKSKKRSSTPTHNY